MSGPETDFFRGTFRTAPRVYLKAGRSGCCLAWEDSEDCESSHEISSISFADPVRLRKFIAELEGRAVELEEAIERCKAEALRVEKNLTEHLAAPFQPLSDRGEL